MTAQDIYPYYLSYSSISIDTRKIEPGDIFFCLRGNSSDGNEYAEEALNKGASYVVMDNPDIKKSTLPEHKIFRVKNSLETLQELSKIHRSHLKIPIIGITGSNGKTTSKEIIRSVLARKMEVFATQGNLNNHIGVPLSLLSIHSHHDIAVIEMGANHQKEIEFLCTLSQPNFGLITNIGKAHLEGFGGIEGVKKGKGELYTYLNENEGLAFIYSGDHRLMELSESLERKLFYGTQGFEFIIGEILSEYPFLKVSWSSSLGEPQKTEVQTHLTGAYNLSNILAAILTGTYFGLTREEIAGGIEDYIPNNNRSQIQKSGNNELILDLYNANPDSMRLSLENFKSYPHPHKLAILGDMLELGEDSFIEHQKIAREVNSMKLENALLVGPLFYEHKMEFPDLHFASSLLEAENWLKQSTWKNYAVLFKGSRGMKLENLLVFFNS
jgi:UDP-N-acetylmuramoyl-tripeptide--D-alanyl-D-alanine ligase